MLKKALILLFLVCISRTSLGQVDPEAVEENPEGSGGAEDPEGGGGAEDPEGGGGAEDPEGGGGAEDPEAGGGTEAPVDEGNDDSEGAGEGEEGTFENKGHELGDMIKEANPLIKYSLYPLAIIARPFGRYTDETMDYSMEFLGESWWSIKKYLMDNYDAIMLYVGELLRTVKDYFMERKDSYTDFISGLASSVGTLSTSVVTMEEADKEPADNSARRRRDITDAMESLDANAGLLKTLGYPYRNVLRGVAESTNDIILEIGNQLFRAIRKVVLPVIIDTLEPFRDSPRVPALLRSVIDNLVVSYKLLAVVNLVGPNA